MDAVQIQVVCDVSKISPNSNTHDNPVGLPHENLYMIAPIDYVAKDSHSQATADLALTLSSGSIVQWSGDTITGGDTYSVVIYDIKHNTGHNLLRDIKFRSYKIDVPSVDTTDPFKYSSVQIKKPFVRADVVIDTDLNDNNKFLQEDYFTYFYITKYNRETGNCDVYGYYYWDPSIRIHDPS